MWSCKEGDKEPDGSCDFRQEISSPEVFDPANLEGVPPARKARFQDNDVGFRTSRVGLQPTVQIETKTIRSISMWSVRKVRFGGSTHKSTKES